MWVDPPSGWRYGFPKQWDEEKDKNKDMKEWLIENGYPKSLIDEFGSSFLVRCWD